MYLPANDIGAIQLRDIVMAMREEGDKSKQSDTVRDIMNRIDAAIEQTLKDKTLKDIVLVEGKSEA